MNFAFSILIYLILFVILLWTFCKYGMSLFSGLTLTALITGVILLLLIPPSEIEHEIDLYFSEKPHSQSDDVIVLIYLLIMVLTLILVSAYVIFKSFEDRHRRKKYLGEDYNCDYKDYLQFWC